MYVVKMYELSMRKCEQISNWAVERSIREKMQQWGERQERLSYGKETESQSCVGMKDEVAWGQRLG